MTQLIAGRPSSTLTIIFPLFPPEKGTLSSDEEAWDLFATTAVGLELRGSKLPAGHPDLVKQQLQVPQSDSVSPQNYDVKIDRSITMAG